MPAIRVKQTEVSRAELEAAVLVVQAFLKAYDTRRQVVFYITSHIN